MAVLGATARAQQAYLLRGTPAHESRISCPGATCLPRQAHARLTFSTYCATHSVDLNLISRESRHPYAARLPSPSHTWSKTPGSALRATSNAGVITDGEDEAVSLGTMEFSGDVDLELFQSLLFKKCRSAIRAAVEVPSSLQPHQTLKAFSAQWANNLTQNANVPLPAPLKVDKTERGLRLSYIRVKDGVVEDLTTIDISVTPGTGGGPSVFRALRSGPLKATAVPGEAEIMLSLKAALIKLLSVCRRG